MVTASVSPAAFIVLMKTTRVARGPFAADCDSIAERPVVGFRLVFIRGPLARPLGGAELSYLYLPPSIRRLRCSNISQPLRESVFSRTSPPIGHFQPSKITSGVDYTLSSASPNYSPACRCIASSQGNGVVSKHARRKGRRPAGLAAAAAISQDR